MHIPPSIRVRIEALKVIYPSFTEEELVLTLLALGAEQLEQPHRKRYDAEEEAA